MDRRRAVGYLLLTVALWSTSGLLIKLLPWNALAISGTRSGIAALLIWAYLRRPVFTWSFAQLGGAVAYVCSQTFFVAATQLTTAANAIFLQYTAPVYVALFGAWFLKERVRPADWLSMAAIFAGMFLFFAGDLSPEGYLGNVFAILAGISFAAMIVLMRKQKDGSPVETALLGNILALAVGLPFIVSELGSGPVLDIQDWGVLAFLGIFQLGIPFILYSKAIRALTALEAVLIQTLEPILNPLWVFLVINERPGPLALVGGFIVLASVAARAVISSRGRRRPPAAATG